jgi:hypothetical protein
VCVNILVCVCKYFCKKKKKIYFALCDRSYAIRSVADTGLRSNSLVFVQALRPTSHTHPYTYAIERTRLNPSRDLFLGHLLLFSPSFQPCAVQPPYSFSLIITHTTTPNHHLFTFGHPPNTTTASAPPPIASSQTHFFPKNS